VTTLTGNAPPSARRGKPSTKRSAKPQSPDAEITNYTTAQRWLFEHVDHERVRFVKYDNEHFSLDRMRRLLDALGSPHEQVRCVQVAGTKGKGSTCAMLTSMLQACGYTIGAFSSPHLIDLRERICVNGQMISYADVAEIFRRIADYEQTLPDGDRLTYFEILTAAALRYFADQAVDLAVLETGLGGRLGYDHMNVLGSKLSSIAREKAGIFKSGVPAISVEQEAEASAVLDEVAADVGAPLEYTGKDIDFISRFEAARDLGPHTRVSVTTQSNRWEHLVVPLRGEHQAHNCALALALLDKLQPHGFKLPEARVIEGLAKTQLPGRMEQVHDHPRVVIDGAHNAASIRALIRSLGAHISYDSLVMIFGCAEDKDITGMLQQVALGADKVLFTRSRTNPRAVEPDELMSRFSELSGKMAQPAANLTEALRLASRAVSREDLIVITGSFYLVGEAKKYFIDRAKRQGKPARA